MHKFDLTGSKTANNLAKAFIGESMARNIYTFYSEIARDEGIPLISDIFLETASNELGHAEIFYDYLSTGLKTTAIQPQISITAEKSTTLKNLLASAKDEFEALKSYQKYAEEAEKEGFKVVAISFAEISKIEEHHKKRFLNLVERVSQDMLYKLPQEITWQCSNCGLLKKGKQAPEICPACHHSQKYFRIACISSIE